MIKDDCHVLNDPGSVQILTFSVSILGTCPSYVILNKWPNLSDVRLFFWPGLSEGELEEKVCEEVVCLRMWLQEAGKMDGDWILYKEGQHTGKRCRYLGLRAIMTFPRNPEMSQNCLLENKYLPTGSYLLTVKGDPQTLGSAYWWATCAWDRCPLGYPTSLYSGNVFTRFWSTWHHLDSSEKKEPQFQKTGL